MYRAFVIYWCLDTLQPSDINQYVNWFTIGAVGSSLINKKGATMSRFHRRHFQIYFREWRLLYFNSNIGCFVAQLTISQQSGNGLAPRVWIASKCRCYIHIILGGLRNVAIAYPCESHFKIKSHSICHCFFKTVRQWYYRALCSVLKCFDNCKIGGRDVMRFEFTFIRISCFAILVFIVTAQKYVNIFHNKIYKRNQFKV